MLLSATYTGHVLKFILNNNDLLCLKFVCVFVCLNGAVYAAIFLRFMFWKIFAVNNSVFEFFLKTFKNEIVISMVYVINRQYAPYRAQKNKKEQ